MDEQIKDVEVESTDGTYEVYEPETESFKIPSVVYKAGGAALAVAGGIAYAKRDKVKEKLGKLKEARKARKVQKHLEALNKLGYKPSEEAKTE